MQATRKLKVYNMRQRNRRDIDFDAKRMEDHLFEMKR